MSRIKQVLILAVIVLAAIAVAAVATYPFAASPVQATQSEKSGIQKWEYCAITSASYAGSHFGGARGVAVIRYFQARGEKEEIVEFVPEMGKSVSLEGREALAKAIAKLGDEGWEMVTKEADRDTNGNFIPIYFKRSKQ